MQKINYFNNLNTWDKMEAFKKSSFILSNSIRAEMALAIMDEEKDSNKLTPVFRFFMEYKNISDSQKNRLITLLKNHVRLAQDKIDNYYRQVKLAENALARAEAYDKQTQFNKSNNACLHGSARLIWDFEININRIPREYYKTAQSAKEYIKAILDDKIPNEIKINKPWIMTPGRKSKYNQTYEAVNDIVELTDKLRAKAEYIKPLYKQAGHLDLNTLSNELTLKEKQQPKPDTDTRNSEREARRRERGLKEIKLTKSYYDLEWTILALYAKFGSAKPLSSYEIMGQSIAKHSKMIQK